MTPHLLLGKKQAYVFSKGNLDHRMKTNAAQGLPYKTHNELETSQVCAAFEVARARKQTSELTDENSPEHALNFRYILVRVIMKVKRHAMPQTLAC